ncbi:hypothetical protein CANARDRAFT_7667 [[Candida] arabinofermentans NRRL YB-2248]|uniref:Uncharacterized protein n=1 Tax=[Candida] arabinofermentans NRRL YB-2248 TaxID=983967 RepID=A0A1E4T1H4_9ASCO|nr:hypothetical protein CANARDRAFT_7667 [[Candida] arabinofermentans NRRL YB-2248]
MRLTTVGSLAFISTRVLCSQLQDFGSELSLTTYEKLLEPTNTLEGVTSVKTKITPTTKATKKLGTTMIPKKRSRPTRSRTYYYEQLTNSSEGSVLPEVSGDTKAEFYTSNDLYTSSVGSSNSIASPAPTSYAYSSLVYSSNTTSSPTPTTFDALWISEAISIDVQCYPNQWKKFVSFHSDVSGISLFTSNYLGQYDFESKADFDALYNFIFSEVPWTSRLEIDISYISSMSSLFSAGVITAYDDAALWAIAKTESSTYTFGTNTVFDDWPQTTITRVTNSGLRLFPSIYQLLAVFLLSVM